ncbi:cell division protein FtsL [Solimicrobium silvestre]|uniref:Cell division protein FtsL n=1 Tax=Solimicrobium silvestre TaxID=2099400 RepID=A0A2S9H5J4_9BURK|nr:cell division protein FtsL [Solimicrobium silvestre]PRC95211.1 Cell division protein FtsL [Solimicrobium silvestre]
MSGRLNVVLLLALMVCALILVRTQYQARHLFIELERSQTEARQLDVEWSQLQLDQSGLGKHERIQASAIKDLNMVPVTPDRTQYITVDSKQTR